MKQVVKEKTVKEYYWEACDGTLFRDEAECKKYDNSAQALLLSHYNKLVVKEASEYDIFKSGSEDGIVELVKLKSREDVDVVMKLLGVMNTYILREDNKKKYNEYKDILEEAMDNNDIVFIYRGYEKDCFCIESTLSNRIKHIQEFCKIE